MSFWNNLFLKNKKAAAEDKPQKLSDAKSGLNEEMISESAEIPPREDDISSEIVEKNGEEAEESAEETAPPEVKENKV